MPVFSTAVLTGQGDHARGNAHRLRELTFLVEQHGQGWAQQMKALLLEVKAAVAQARSTGATELSQAQRQAFTRRYQQRVEQGFADNPAPETHVGQRRVAQTPAGKQGQPLLQALTPALLGPPFIPSTLTG